MWTYPEHFDVIVIGAGHAGCEAAHASAKMGARTLMLTMNLDTIGKMSCNPAIGGTAKGHIVREIDALGGLMGKVADRTGIQFRMLNASKGPAVWSPRAQSDRAEYAIEMKHELEKLSNLSIKQGTIESLCVENGRIKGVKTKEGIAYVSETVIVSAGTFMRGLLHIGDTKYDGGRAGDKPSVGLSKELEQLGLSLGRLKTGTPPRVNKRTIDFSVCEEQPSEEHVVFSYDNEPKKLEQVSCYITYTSQETKDLIQKNLHRAPMYSGAIHSVGPRYCPSIEDKVVRFAEKERHQIFLEPEGLRTEEVYVNGISTSLPFDVQYAMIKSVPGLERADIMRCAYAIEYDYLTSGQLRPTLETKGVEGLFMAGQVNGTTGYEEAAAQGLIAGINAACQVAKKPPFTLSRSEAYIGVLIDDIITKDLQEPYRMFTSRAEHRLLLRQDNADLRLRGYGYSLGLISEAQYKKLTDKQNGIEHAVRLLKAMHKPVDGKVVNLAKYLSRPDSSYTALHALFPDDIPTYSDDTLFQIELTLRYEGYIKRQMEDAEKARNFEDMSFPKTFDFSKVVGLRNEAKEKLLQITPSTVGQASRITGVSPADISVLMVAIKKHS